MKSTKSPAKSRTRILFDLAAILTTEELAKFQKAATDAGKSLTDHFLALTIKTPTQSPQ